MVGLTGGIGSGKSTVAQLLIARGAVVVDADLIARQVVEPGTPALEQAGRAVRAPRSCSRTGRSTGPTLAERAFGTDEAKQDLEAITHPAIGEEFLRQVAAAPADGIVVHDVPLLVESKRGLQYDAVIVVETPKPERLDRLEQRGIPRDDAERRMALQATDDERRAIATWVLDNSGDLANLEAQVERVWAELQRQAENKAKETPAKP